MNEWLEWFGYYLAAGVGIFLIVRITTWVQEKTRSKAETLKADFQAIIKSLEPEKTLKDRVIEVSVYALILLIWPVAIITFVIDELLRRYRKRKKHAEGGIPEFDWGDSDTGNGKTDFDYGCWLEHLKEEVDPESVEAAHLIADPLNKVPSVPFGFLNSAWLAFRAQIKPGDQVHSYAIKNGEKYGKLDYTCKGHIAGYALVRDGKIVKEFSYETD